MLKLLRKVYKQLNNGLFGNELPAVEFVPNIQRKQVFHFRPPSVIEMGAKCADTDREEFLDDLLHAMVHVSNWSNDVTDVTRNQYHKIEFCNAALGVGLYVMCHPTRGWGLTCSSETKALGDKVRVPQRQYQRKLQQVYRSVKWDDAAFSQFQKEMQNEIEKRPQKQFQFKYVCSCDPPFIVRVGRRPDGECPFQAKCLRCDSNFVLDE